MSLLTTGISCFGLAQSLGAVSGAPSTDTCSEAAADLIHDSPPLRYCEPNPYSELDRPPGGGVLDLGSALCLGVFSEEWRNSFAGPLPVERTGDLAASSSE